MERVCEKQTSIKKYKQINCILKICSDFTENLSLTFYSNKSMCIKIGKLVHRKYV